MSLSAALSVGVVGSVVIAVLTFVTGRPRRAAHRVTAALGWLWAAGIVGLTFGTPPVGGQAVNVELLNVGNTADIKDFLVNIAMFVPGGILLAVAHAGYRWACIVGALGSLTIEVTQYLTASGRTADINDLLANTAGCIIGYLCAAAVRKTTSRRAPNAE